MKGQGGGGTARGGGKNRSGGGAVKTTKTKARQTSAIDANIIKLRESIFDANGRDKNVTIGIAPSFMKYERNGLDLSIEFAAQLTKEEADWAFDVVKDNMEERYDRSGYGWDDEDKERELTEKGGRFLLVREWPIEGETCKGNLVAFVHFRFTVQGEVIDAMGGETQVYVYDIHVEEEFQRKGLGKHLLIILELIARKEKMSFLSIPIQLHDNVAKQWLEKTGRGFAVDNSLGALGFDADVEGFEVYTKALQPPQPRPVTAAVPAPAALTEAPSASATATSAATTSNASTGVFNFAATAAALPTTTTTTAGAGAGAGADDCTTDGEESGPAVPAEKEGEVIAQLSELFEQKHGRAPTQEEVGMWLKSIRSLEEDDLKERTQYISGSTTGSSSSGSSSVDSDGRPVEDDWVQVEKEGEDA